jgi:hypothetical protein
MEWSANNNRYLCNLKIFIFSSGDIGIHGIEAINVGESSVTGTGEEIIHAHQDQLERYVYKSVHFVVLQEIHWICFSYCLFFAISIAWCSSTTLNIMSIKDLKIRRTREVFIGDVMIVCNTYLDKANITCKILHADMTYANGT